MTDIQKKTIESGGVKIYYEACVTSPEAPVLFLLHGIGGDLDAWRFVRDDVLEQGFSTVAMDLRGHGYSGHPARAEAYAIDMLVRDVLAVMDAEQLTQVVLVGHSGGAVLALEVALRYPQKLSSLVLLAGSYCPPAYLRLPLLKRVADLCITIGAFVSPPARGPWHSPYPVGKFHREFELYGLLRTMYHNSLRSYLWTGAQLAHIDLEDKLGSITMPTLLVVGEKDSIYPAAISQKMHARIPQSRLVLIPEANHVIILNNSADVAKHMSEFARTPSPKKHGQ